MVTGGNESSFTGVYKLAARTGGTDGALVPAMKFSDNPEKTTNPGIKQVWRLYNADGTFKADILAEENEHIVPGEMRKYFHPANDWKSFSFSAARTEPLLRRKMRNGSRCEAEKTIDESRAHMEASLDRLDGSYKRILNPHIYKVSLTEQLRQEKLDFLRSKRRNKP